MVPNLVQKHFSACIFNKIIEDKSNNTSPWILNQVQNDERYGL